MKIREFMGSIVLDKNANEVGKVENVDFDTKSGKIGTVTLSLQKNIFTKDEIEINFEDIETIGTYVILNKVILSKNADGTVEVEIEDEN